MVYFTNSFFSSRPIQEGGLFKRAFLSRAYCSFNERSLPFFKVLNEGQGFRFSKVLKVKKVEFGHAGAVRRDRYGGRDAAKKKGERDKPPTLFTYLMRDDQDKKIMSTKLLQIASIL